MARHSINIEQVSEANKAWFAGFLDGEGSVDLYPSGRRSRKFPQFRAVAARLHIANTNHEVIRRCQEIWQCGNVYEIKPIGAKLRTWLWTVDGNAKVYHILNSIIPFLVVKKYQAVLVRDFCERKSLVRFHPQHKPQWDWEEDYFWVDVYKRIKQYGKEPITSLAT